MLKTDGIDKKQCRYFLLKYEFVDFTRFERSSISVVRVFEDDTFILYEFLLRGEMFNLAINPALRLYNVTHWLSFYLL